MLSVSDGDADARAVSVGSKLVDVAIVGSLGHAAEVEGSIVGDGDFMTREGRNFVGFQRSDDFGCDEDQEFRFFLIGSFAGEERGPDSRDRTEEGDAAVVGKRLIREETSQHDRLAFAKFDGGVDTSGVEAGDSVGGIGIVDFGQFGSDSHADEILIDDGGSHDHRGTEAAEDGLLSTGTAESDDGGDCEFTTGEDRGIVTAECDDRGFGEDLPGLVGMKSVDEDADITVVDDGLHRGAGAAAECGREDGIAVVDVDGDVGGELAKFGAFEFGDDDAELDLEVTGDHQHVDDVGAGEVGGVEASVGIGGAEFNSSGRSVETSPLIDDFTADDFEDLCGFLAVACLSFDDDLSRDGVKVDFTVGEMGRDVLFQLAVVDAKLIVEAGVAERLNEVDEGFGIVFEPDGERGGAEPFAEDGEFGGAMLYDVDDGGIGDGGLDDAAAGDDQLAAALDDGDFRVDAWKRDDIRVSSVGAGMRVSYDRRLIRRIDGHGRGEGLKGRGRTGMALGRGGVGLSLGDGAEAGRTLVSGIAGLGCQGQAGCQQRAECAATRQEAFPFGLAAGTLAELLGDVFILEHP